MTSYSHCMTMLSVRVDQRVAGSIDAWCSRHDTPRSDFLREAVRRELDRRRAIDEAEWLAGLGDSTDDDAAASSAFDAIEAWGPHDDWSKWHEWLDSRDEEGAASRGPSGSGDDRTR